MIRLLAQSLVDRRPRERALLAVLALVVLPLALWALVLAPLAQETRRLSARTVEARDLLVWLGEQASPVGPVAPEAAALPPPAPADVERSLAAAGLGAAVTRVTSGQDGRIALGFDAVTFAAAMDWLDTGRPEGLRLVDLRIDRGAGPGLVRLDAVLEAVP